MATQPVFACPCCGGSGKLDLTGGYLETYRALAAAGETWAAKLAAELGCKATAANNRLAGLEAKGLAVSRRWGRRRLFTAVTWEGGNG